MGTFVTVTAAVALLPSLAAVTVAVPAATPVTRPLADTVATPALELVHVTARLVNAFPTESLGVAVSCTLCPATTLAEAGLRATDATGTFETVTVEVPLGSTAATAPLLVAHVTMWPLSGLPLASFSVAVNCCIAPSERVALVGLTDTDATGLLVTITVASALKPLPVAATTYPPGFGPA